jgi:hypothetical protein
LFVMDFLPGSLFTAHTTETQTASTAGQPAPQFRQNKRAESTTAWCTIALRKLCPEAGRMKALQVRQNEVKMNKRL